MRPRTLLHATSLTEAVTWAALILAMIMKYVLVVPAGTIAVSVAGSAHGTVFLAYLFSVITVASAERWRNGTIVLGGVCAIIPFATLWFDVHSRRVAARLELASAAAPPSAAAAIASASAPATASVSASGGGRLNRTFLRLTAGLPGWVAVHPLTLAAAALALLVVVTTQSLTR